MKRLKPIVVNLAQKKKKTRIKIQSKQQRLKQYKFNMLMKMMESPLQLSEYWVNAQKFLLMKTSLSSTGSQSSMKHCLMLNMDEQRWKLGKKSSRVYSKVELLVSERDKSLYPMCFAQKKPKINSNEKVQKIKQEVYEKFMKSKNICDIKVVITQDC